MCLYFLLQFGSGHSISSPEGLLSELVAAPVSLLLLLLPVGVLRELELDRLRLEAFGPSRSSSFGRPLRFVLSLSSDLDGLAGALRVRP